MAAARPATITDTASTKNREILVLELRSLDDMETALVEVAADHGMYISHVTTLGRRRYPGNRHWHLKRDPGESGCLDVTYWPDGPLMWISIRNSEPAWVHDAGQHLGPALERHLAAPEPPA